MFKSDEESEAEHPLSLCDLGLCIVVPKYCKTANFSFVPFLHKITICAILAIWHMEKGPLMLHYLKELQYKILLLWKGSRAKPSAYKTRHCDRGTVFRVKTH